MTSTYDITKAMLKLAGPVIATSLGNTVSSIICMLMVATLGHQLLAAGALATSSYVTLIAFSNSFFMAVGILISHAKGKNHEQDISTLIHNGLIVAIWLAIPVTILLWFFPHILLLFHQDPKLVALTVSYFHLAAIGVLPAMLTFVFQQFFTGIGKPQFNFYATLVRVPIAVLISYAFIFGKWHLPALGLGGIMAGQAITFVFYLLFYALYLKFKGEFACYHFFTADKFYSHVHCMNIIKIGLPIGLQFGVELSAMTLVTYFTGWLGAVALAAQQIVSQCTMIVVMITLGISQAVSIMVSHAYGQDDYQLIRQTGTIGFVLGLSAMLLIAIVYMSFPHELIQLFINTTDPANHDLVHLATVFLYLSAILLIIDSLRNITAGALRGMHDSQTPMWLGTACLWFISIPLSYLTAFTFHYGAVGLRVGFMSGFIVCTSILLTRFYHKIGHKIMLTQQAVT